jgi:hypothetical protein
MKAYVVCGGLFTSTMMINRYGEVGSHSGHFASVARFLNPIHGKSAEF